MPVEIVMPKLGLNMTEGLILEWLKQEGDRVERGEPLFVVETDKVTSETQAQASGTLSKILIASGETVPVRTVVALISLEDEVAQAEAPAPAAVEKPAGWANIVGASPAARREPTLATPVAKRIARELGVDLARVRGSGPGGRILQEDVERASQALKAPPAGRILASPGARRLAREHGISLEELRGSGPDGQIVQADVERQIQARQAVPPQPASHSIPIDGVRAVIARRMSESVQSTAQVTLHTEVDATALVENRRSLKAQVEAGASGDVPSYNALLAMLVARALREHPRLNASQEGETIRLKEQVNVGLAVDTEAGLMVVVITDADRKTAGEIEAELKVLVERAVSKKSLPEDLEGSTFTITNLGMYGIDGFTPIINPPEMAILGVGRIVEKLVILNSKVAQRHMLNLSLTFDHRLVDGAPAARFLQTLCNSIESFQKL